jgi:hypothetical protein
MYFCIRDDDTSFFTSPDALEQAYAEISRWGPISLAIVPFHRAGTSKAIPERFRGQQSVHALHDNRPLVEYLRARIAEGRFEAMLHGYHHDEPDGRPEFLWGKDLAQKIIDGRNYLENVLGASVRVFVPPHNAIGPKGLRAVAQAKLHLGCLAGVRSGWSPLSPKTWMIWFKLRQWQRSGGLGIPWVLDLGDHREIAGNPVTPLSTLDSNTKKFDAALRLGGVFCAATHYWELSAPSLSSFEPKVGEHLCFLADLAHRNPRVIWRKVGDVISQHTLSH